MSEQSPLLARREARLQAILEKTPVDITPPLTTVRLGVEAQKLLNFAIEMRRKKTQSAGSPERAEEIARELLAQMNGGQAGGAATAAAPTEPAGQEATHQAAQQPEEAIDGPPSFTIDDDAMGELFEDANVGDETIDLDLGMSELAHPLSKADEPVDVAGNETNQEPPAGSSAARMRALLKESGLG